tara:strand:+ start:291 stop:500 length:210 start_codon:yes stop_codon:yes gene_type:complete
MKRAIEALRAVLDHVAEELVLEEYHPRVDQFDYDLFVYDIGKLSVKAKEMLEKIKYGAPSNQTRLEVKE